MLYSFLHKTGIIRKIFNTHSLSIVMAIIRVILWLIGVKDIKKYLDALAFTYSLAKNYKYYTNDDFEIIN